MIVSMSKALRYKRRYDPTFVFREDFAYPNGEINAVSGGRWVVTGTGTMVVSGTQLTLQDSLAVYSPTASALVSGFNHAKAFNLTCLFRVPNKTQNSNVPGARLRMNYNGTVRDFTVQSVNAVGGMVNLVYPGGTFGTGIPADIATNLVIRVEVAAGGNAIAFVNNLPAPTPFTMFQGFAGSKNIDLFLPNGVIGGGLSFADSVLLQGYK